MFEFHIQSSEKAEPWLGSVGVPWRVNWLVLVSPLVLVSGGQPVLTQLLQQGGDGSQDRLDGALGLAGVVLRLLSVIRSLEGTESNITANANS